ncbi:hypothetical protein [Ectothiorhodospira variabilis]|uniref:hypothetical protein n=1 Tax=Ectothiorhodospira variabilis TaxID=505694 RepID=UPI001EFC10D9|nr:hypothetical protein [Ectothiorhodospira variabilis]MCG5497785.1 hypothetical protein [Ectothiorhodospira variabilis]
MEEYQGAKLTIRYCEQPPPGSGAEAWMPPSLQEALDSIQAGKHARWLAGFAARRKQLANTGRLRSPDYWNTEGDLPNGKNFYAIKVGKIRAYGWYSNRHGGVFYISHFAFKKGQKLAQKDTHRVIQNWRKIEE